MISAEIRKLKNNLSRYLKRVQAGESFALTDHGRIVAQLVPPVVISASTQRSGCCELLKAGVVRPPVEAGNPLANLPAIRLPRGTAARLINEDRGDR